MVNIIHITHYFFPEIGGQEKLIKMMIKANTKGKNYVIQPLKLAFFNPKNNPFASSKEFNIIPLPTLSFFLYFFFKLIKLDNKFSKELDTFSWFSFNLSLKLLFPAINFFLGNSKVIIHYHFHESSVFSSKKIVFSHGIEWDFPPKKLLDKCRIKKLKKMVINNECKLIANDKNYLNAFSQINQSKFSAKNIYLLPNPVDNLIFKKTISFKLRKKFRGIIIVRNIREDRGILEAITAFKYLDNSWELNIIGKFNIYDEYYNLCKKEAEGFNIHFHGHKNQNFIINLMNQSILSLVPSQSKEGTSLSALESMSLGLPCISTNVGGLSDLPTFKSKGIDGASIYIAILDLLTDYEYIAESQYNIVINNYSIVNWRKQFLNILNEKI